MASGGFTRAELREILGEAHTDEIATRLIALHRSTQDPIKDDLDSANRELAKYKTEAAKVADLQKKLEEYEKGEDWKAKYEKEKADHDAYKAKVAQDAQAVKIKAAYKKLLTEEQVDFKDADLEELILNAIDYSQMKLKDDGTLDGAEDLKKDIATRWHKFQVSTRQRGERVDNPPRANNGRMSKEEILAIKDTTARQKAIAENLEAFQKG